MCLRMQLYMYVFPCQQTEVTNDSFDKANMASRLLNKTYILLN